jgi:hypothetical protein
METTEARGGIGQGVGLALDGAIDGEFGNIDSDLDRQ